MGVTLVVPVSVLVPKLISRMFIRAKNDTTYLMGDVDLVICGNFAINASFKVMALLTLGAHAQRGLRYLGLSVCVCVCLLSQISPLERLFVLKILSRTQRATEVKKFVGFSLKPLRSRVVA